ncbi:50S ribosomal protein L9 [Mycoplasma tauri]|uniref:50S ribosomal protein L9 n=1 Tax=Mycoplasma tauri TaxID=547987 RepID=UPI001967A0C9|nr:50S ribosomal protein L9 [Mycoplasma tauri]MBZ4203682.1 50S ribosomal protein L9 [Mycoplasma tauri]MBZ4212815.1 50S ribosomal protein L9 [Mycoplasma tauri]MBZ4226883.1 50S ribosomal protein L9 [Mycoplasma tauri]QSB07554.1 50S ribosomal protein L9 [Mycoplasma tauri]
MKVILIKDCKDGQANTIIEVSNGYGSNFLVKKGFGVPYNEITKKQLEKRLSALTAQEMEKRSEALLLKESLEKQTLKFTMDANIDANGNLNVHGAVSTKEIVKSLAQLGYKLDKYAVQKVHLVSNGEHLIDVVVYKDIIAKLKVVLLINVK